MFLRLDLSDSSLFGWGHLNEFRNKELFPYELLIFSVEGESTGIAIAISKIKHEQLRQVSLGQTAIMKGKVSVGSQVFLPIKEVNISSRKHSKCAGPCSKLAQSL